MPCQKSSWMQVAEEYTDSRTFENSYKMSRAKARGTLVKRSWGCFLKLSTMVVDETCEKKDTRWCHLLRVKMQSSNGFSRDLLF